MTASSSNLDSTAAAFVGGESERNDDGKVLYCRAGQGRAGTAGARGNVRGGLVCGCILALFPWIDCSETRGRYA